MGNQSTKKSGDTPFTAEELKILEASFRSAAPHTDGKLTKEKLLISWSNTIDEHLAQCTVNFLYQLGQQRVTTITLRRYGEPFYIVERGTTDDKLNFLALCLDKTNSNQFSMKEMEMYVTSVFKSYLLLLSDQDSQVYKCWKSRGYETTERSILAFSKGLIRSLSKENENRVDLDKLERWLQVNPTFLIIWKEVFANLYSKNASGKLPKLGSPCSTFILPLIEGLSTGTNYSPILDIPHVIFVNSNLPNEFRHKWRFLFSSKIMGESFSTMLGKILNKGPTLFIVEDEDRYIFGAYAPHSWTLSPNFVGDDSSMLFTLSPAMRCFAATTYNDHYQYLNLHQQTMPNGLGVGGQFNYWGLWLDCEYGLGQSSESCTTFYDYVQLSKRKDFKIRNLEVWGIGDEPKLNEDSDEEEGQTNKRSILDKNMEDRVMLELSGRKMHSDGLRDPDLDL